MHSNFDRDFKRSGRTIGWFATIIITLSVLMTVGIIAFYLLVGSWVVQNGPEGVGEVVGRIEQGYESTKP